jgi:hypothetical protein
MKFVAAIITIMALTSAANAQSLLETTDQARQRHNAERYELYKSNNYNAPLGGYSDKLGDSAPRGTDLPGYTSPQSYGDDHNSGYQKSNNSRARY